MFTFEVRGDWLKGRVSSIVGGISAGCCIDLLVDAAVARSEPTVRSVLCTAACDTGRKKPMRTKHTE